MNDAFVPDPQAVLPARTIQPLMQAALDPPVFPFAPEQRLGIQLVGRAAGDQIFHFGRGRRTALPVQTTDLRGPGQSQLDRFNCPGGQGAAFLAAAIVLPLDHLRGELPPAGGFGRWPTARFGCL